ncbi:hypothetical protein ACRN9Z_13290 [Shewanella frigidimarina]|uniref:hypothetical protein n=1 Tax=Shewanella frigidimarina TaxID=56812 RepID=UPI003D796166
MSLLKLDREVFFSIFAQLLNLIFPLMLFIYISRSFDLKTIVIFESVLSFISFSSILQDFGSSFFFSFKKYSEKSWGKVLGSMILLKFLLSVFLVFVLVMFFLFFDITKTEIMYSTLIILIGCFDLPFIFYSKAKTHIYSFIVSFKFPVCFIFILFGFSVLSSFLFSYILVCTVITFFNFNFCAKNIRFSFKLAKCIFGKYKKFTLTEVLTAVFSQLDGFIVVQLMKPEQAYIYLLIRKVIRAVNALVNHVYRISFTRSKKGDDSFFKILIQLFLFNVVFVFIVNIISLYLFEEINYLVSYQIYSKDVFVLVALLQSSILIVGFFKVVIRNNYLLTNEFFDLHLYATLLSFLFFISPLFFYYLHSLTISASEISLYRILADVIYVLFVLLVYVSAKFFKRNQISG